MYIYKRFKTYWVKFTVDGVRHQVSTHAKTLKDARFFASSIDAARQAPTLEDAIAVLKTLWRERPTKTIALDEIWETYERIAKTVGRLSASEKTIGDRKNHVAAFVKWSKKNAATVKNAEDVTGRVAVLYAQHLAECGSKTKTRKNTISDLSTVWRMLEKSSTAIRNPWTSLAPTDTEGARGEPFTREQEAAVFKAAKAVGKDWFAVCAVARHTGLRYGDIANLRWDEVHLGKEAHIHTRPNKTARHGVEVFVPLVKEVADALGKLERRGDFVFPEHEDRYNQFGGKLTMKFREVLDAAGIEGERYSFHSWRHTFRTRLAESGSDIETAMRLCGHTQKETSRRYDHASHADELRKAIEDAAH